MHRWDEMLLKSVSRDKLSQWSMGLPHYQEEPLSFTKISCKIDNK